MDQQNPNDPDTGLNSGTSGNIGSGGTSTGAGYASGGTGTGMSSGGGMTTGSGGTSSGTGSSSTVGAINAGPGSAAGPTSGSDLGGGGSTDEYCAHCGHALSESKGLEQFLGRLGISGDMFTNLKGQFSNVDIDEYMNTAREYLKGGTTKVTSYTKENPAKVAAGVAALALGAGLIYAAVNRGKEEIVVEDTTIDASGREVGNG